MLVKDVQSNEMYQWHIKSKKKLLERVLTLLDMYSYTDGSAIDKTVIPRIEVLQEEIQ